MTTPASAAPLPADIARFLAPWVQALSQVLGQIAGADFPMELKPEPPPEPPGEGGVLAIVTAGGALRGEMALWLPPTSTLAVAQVFLAETQDPTVQLTAEHREAAEELLRQVAGHVATALKPERGEVQLGLQFGAPPSWPAGAEGWIGSAGGAPADLGLEWKLSAALLALLRQVPAAVKDAIPAADVEVPAAAVGNLALFMDVELDVTLRFGGRRMLLREILELGSGSVVELDRQVQEPADLLLDGKLIARGEVVVVDGSYGLRILEIVAGNFAPGVAGAQPRP